MTTAAIINRAADRLEKPGAWIQHILARNANGYSVMPRDKDAICWCLTGALILESGGDIGSCISARRAVAKEIGVRFLTGWNDCPGRTQSEVVTALREAAKIEFALDHIEKGEI